MLKFAKPKLLNLTRKRKLRARLSMSLFTSLLSGGGGGYGGRINVRQINLNLISKIENSPEEAGIKTSRCTKADCKVKNQEPD